MKEPTTITEHIASGRCEPLANAPRGVTLQAMVSDGCGATAFTTGIATFAAEADLSYHTHTVSEAITVLHGHADVAVEGRVYYLSQRDCIHVPAGVAHAVRNPETDCELVAHTAFASPAPTRQFVETNFRLQYRGLDDPAAGLPETVRRYAKAEIYELSPGAHFCDLFARRLGSVGICGGFGYFDPGASLPCHTHVYDESITIVEGEAVCLVQGKQYQLSGCDTAFVPKGRPHRFLNQSQSTMAMVWVYAGDEPDRMIVDAGYCSGSLTWPHGEGNSGSLTDGSPAARR